jgi:hypothetical protein
VDIDLILSTLSIGNNPVEKIEQKQFNDCDCAGNPLKRATFYG